MPNELIFVAEIFSALHRELSVGDSFAQENLRNCGLSAAKSSSCSINKHVNVY